MNRKEFLASSLLDYFGLSFGSNKITSFSKSQRKKINGPFAIATWNVPKATQVAFDFLSKKHTALDAIENGCNVEELDISNSSVGLGGLPDRTGSVTLDACIMDHKGNCGSVVYLKDITQAISVARKVMEKTPHVMLAGDGAKEFAISEGFKTEELLSDNAKKKYEEWKKTSNYKPIINIENHDTIGMLAIDINGNISGGCTTSGLAYKMKGRVGDSPIIGAGLFVDNAVGGAVATGLGEEVVKTVGSFLIVELMRQGMNPQEACEEAISRITQNTSKDIKDFQVGFIAINKKGEMGAHAIHKHFNFTITSEDKTENIEASYHLKH